MISPPDDLLLKMEKFKNDFLINEGKNAFFKKGQKMDCAQKMSVTFNLQEMINKTVFVIPNTNQIIFDYTIFKLYAHPDNYELINDNVIKIYDAILLHYPSFEVNVILDSFTISAAERYKGAIQQFCKRCMNANTKYSQLISKMYIYYTPSMMDSISVLLKPFIDKAVAERIVLYSKVKSPEILKKLLSK